MAADRERGPETAEVERVVADVLASDDPTAAAAAACAEHPALAPRIRSSLDALRRLGMLDEPAAIAGPVDRIAGFRLVEVLGRGGMGVVYRAVDPELQREVALKVLRPELLHFEDSRRRFQREIDSVSRLRHPGIVAVLSAREAEGVPFFTMELVEGVSLAATVAALRGQPIGARRGADLLGADAARRSGRSSTGSPRLSDGWERACLQVGRMIAEALQHAHERGVYHRDVKPSNVIVDEHGRARLLDFGLARLESGQELTRSSSLLGSLPYMPPEQIEHGPGGSGPRQDVYSLGVTLYELLSLEQPFLAATAEETRRRVAAGDARGLRSLEPSISRDCAIVCHKAMDLDPARRYASARELADDLDNLLERRPIRACPTGPLLRLWRLGQRHPTASVAVVLGVLVVLASVFAATAALRSRQIERASRDELVDSNLTFAFEFAQGLRRIPGNTEVRRELLQRAVDQLVQLEGDRGLDAGRVARIADAHLALAEVLGKPDQTNVGLREVAAARYRHVLEALVPRVATDRARLGAALQARATAGLATIMQFEGEHDRAMLLQDEAVAALQPLLADTPADPLDRLIDDLYLQTQARRASIAGSQGRHDVALQGFEAVRARHRLRAQRRPGDDGVRFDLLRAGADVALALYMLGRAEQAVDEYEPFVALLDQRLAAAPDDPNRAFLRLARGVPFVEMLIQAGQLDRAIDECRAAIARCDELQADDASNANLPRFRTTLVYDLGWAQQERAEAAIAAGAPARSAAVRGDLLAARENLQAAHALFRDSAAGGRMASAAREERITERLEAVARRLGER